MQKLAFRRDLPAILKFEINIIMDRELPFQEMYREPPLHVHYYIAATADNIFSRLKRLRRLSILLSSFFFLSFLLGLFTKIYNYEFPWV